jgi:very-short-patch-repair endonuclease
MLAAEETLLTKIALGEVSARLSALAAGEHLTLIGVGIDRLHDILRNDPTGIRSALLLGPEGGHTADAILDQLVTDLAELALDRWPRWYGRDTAQAEELLVDALADPLVSAPWLRAAVKRVNAGHVPRFRKSPRALEFAQLMRAIDPLQPTLIAELDVGAPARAAATIQVLEWCTAHGGSVVALLPTRPPPLPPYDRILYGALEVVRAAMPVAERFIVAPSRAHHASEVEQKMEAALRRDPELGPLFVCNETVSISGFGSPRVDLLWRDGRVVVELDGPEHQDDPTFGHDRHRDYELLVAGYLVLRITNHQAQTDLARAIEKIRAVVRLRNGQRNLNR